MTHQRTLLPETKTRFERFVEFHGEHPEVYQEFERFARIARKAGVQRYGARAIWERLRWHFRVERREDDFKLNDHFTAYYARLLMLCDPERFDGFFERRDGRFDVDDTTLLVEAGKACDRARLREDARKGTTYRDVKGT